MGIWELGGGAIGGLIGGPAGTAAGAAAGGKLPGILTNLFGGAGRDAQRQARVDWFLEQALAGSPTAARVLFGGVANTASHEAPMYTAAIESVRARRPDVLNAAVNGGGPYWDTTDNASSDKMRAVVNAELATLHATQASVPGVPTMPVMQTTASAMGAPASFNPLVLVGIAAALVLLFVLARHKG